MGNGLSVSSIVDKLYALEPEARSTALDDLCEQHHEIKLYLKTKYPDNQVPLSRPKPSRPKPSQPSHLQVLSINESVPDGRKLAAKYASWSKDITSFWTSASSTFIPEETSCRPLRFIYDATVRLESETHESCLRSRYLALFWFDYFTKRNQGKETGFDRDYKDLGREIAGVEANADDSIIPRLRKQVRAGRRYNRLTERFGDGILLVLPSSIGRSTLEQKLPLKQDAFETFVSPLVGSGWDELAKTELIDSSGANVRRSLLERCLMQQVHGTSQAPSTSSQKSTKRKAHPSQAPRASSRKSKKPQKHPSDATIRSRMTSISTSSPITPLILQQVYSLEGFGVSDAGNTYQANQGSHEHQCLRPATLETAQASAQAGDERPLHLYGVGNLSLPRNAHYVTNQRATEENGDMALPAGTETTLKTGENKGVQGEDPMLSNLSAADWDNRVFRPMRFEPDLFMPTRYEFDPLLSVAHASSDDLGTSSSPI